VTGLILPYGNHVPLIHPRAFVAPNATVIGDVELADQASLWFGVIVRGDDEPIRIGARSNIQDGSVIHVSSKVSGTTIGCDVTVGHMVLLHACTLQDGSFVGMGSTLLDEVVVETGAMVAAGSLVTPGKIVKAGELWGGRPARKMRDMGADEIAYGKEIIAHYVKRGAEYAEILKRSLAS
jgi:carbonic anhydrase/acetyltransferase-like protein (isoleucine patch superfamily)